MEKEFIPFNEGIALKQLGFDESCFGYYYYNGNFRLWHFENHNEDAGFYSAPLYQQAFRWFRENHGLHIPILSVGFKDIKGNKTISWSIDGTPYNSLKTYEEAQLECLRKLIEIIKNK